MEALNSCPHHGFCTWLLVSYFYDGISPAMKQLLETMCGGDFLRKNPEEPLDFLGYVAEASKGWNEPNPREMERMKPQPSTRGGMYSLPEDLDTICLFMYRLNHSILMPLLEPYSSPTVDQNWRKWLDVLETINGFSLRHCKCTVHISSKNYDVSPDIIP